MTGMSDDGKAVGRTDDGKVVFVEKAVAGDVVDVRPTKQKKGYAEGYPLAFKELSADRTVPFCRHFGVCGGCKWQHLHYDAQLAHKEDIVHNALFRIGKQQAREVLPILPAQRTQYYRNKLEYTFSNKRWLEPDEMQRGDSNLADVLGYHRPSSFDKIVEIAHCHLQPDPSNSLRDKFAALAREQALSFYDLREKKGFLRSLMLRTSTLGQTMAVVCFSTHEQAAIDGYMAAAAERCPELNSLYYCVNTKVNDYMFDLEMHLHSGQPFIEERLGDVRFKIGPKSFFQTNPEQAKVLYDVVAAFAGLEGTENVYDLYTGTGSIALYLAKHCRQVVGIEEVAEAIADANMNKDLNKMENAVFYSGDVKDVLTGEFAARHGRPDVVVTDPPRAGMHPKAIAILLELEAPKIVYVSCKPSTQARDIQLLGEKYELAKIRPVDMFPHSPHIENVALLLLKRQAE